MEQNNEFTTQTGDIEELKKKRTSKKKIDVAQEQTKEIGSENTPVIQGNFIDIQLAKYDLAQEVIDGWKKDFMALTITDVNDKEAMIKVVDAHRIVKNTRVQVEKTRKHLKEDSLSFGRAVDTEAKRLTALLEPIEEYLESQKNIVEIEKERIRVEKENFVKTRMQARTTILLSFGAVFNGETFTLQEGEEVLSISALDAKLTDDVQFNILQLKCEILHEKSKIRIANEQEAARIESERVATIAAQQKEEADRLAKQMAEIKAAQEVLDKQKRDMEIAEEKRAAVAKAEADAKIKAEQEKELALKTAEEEKTKALQAAENKRLVDIAAIEKAAQDKIIADKKIAEDKLAAEIAENARIAKEKALAPEKEKLVLFAEVIAVTTKYLPEMTTESGKTAIAEIKAGIEKLAAYVKLRAEKL